MDEKNTGGEDLHARQTSLRAAIEAQRGAEERARAARLTNRPGVSSDAGHAMNLGFRVLAELLAGIVVGLAIGYGLDHWLHTQPFLMILFLLLGTAAAVLNVIRAANQTNRRPGK